MENYAIQRRKQMVETPVGTANVFDGMSNHNPTESGVYFQSGMLCRSFYLLLRDFLE